MAEAFIVVPSEPVYKTVTVEVPGIQGVAGKDGSDGATFKPTVNANGDLSWSNNMGLANPATVNIRGPQGIQGIPGVKGDPGAGLTILGDYASYDALVSAHPTGDGGDAYLVKGEIWYWAEEQNKWASAGELQGPKGGDGLTPVISFRVDENGNLYYSYEYMPDGDEEAY